MRVIWMAPRVGKLRPVICSDWLLGYFCILWWDLTWPIFSHLDLAPVVWKLDSTIHQINCYPEDKYYDNQLRYPVDSYLSSGKCYPPFEQLGPDVWSVMHKIIKTPYFCNNDMFTSAKAMAISNVPMVSILALIMGMMSSGSLFFAYLKLKCLQSSTCKAIYPNTVQSTQTSKQF